MKCDEIKPIDLECNMGKDINGVEHREPWKAYDIDEVNAAIAELKAENKKLKASSEQIMNEMFRKVLIYPHEMVSLEDAYKLAVSLKNTKRALWLARAERAKEMKAIENLDNYLSLHKNSKWFGIYATRIDTWFYKWDDVERKCLKKAEEYK